MIQELIKRLAPIAGIHSRVDEFAQIFDTRVSLRCVLFLKLLDVTRAVDQEFKNLGSAGIWRGTILTAVEGFGIRFLDFAFRVF